MGHGHALERGHRLLGLVLLRVAQDGVEDDDDQDHHRLDPVAQHRRNQRGDEQEDRQHAGQLLDDDLLPRAAAFFDQLVRADLGQPLLRLGARQARAGSLPSCLSVSSADSLYQCVFIDAPGS